MRVLTMLSLLPLFFLRKNSSGRSPPTVWLRPVASAAPVTSIWNPAMNSASSPMLVSPAATITASPSLGRSAVTRKL